MTATDGRPAIFGEVLYDRFPDGMSVLGGAPFNVAWHLHGFGMQPLMITAVGEDEAGEKIIDTMDEWGMDTSGMQITPEYPTGQVEVSFAAGEPKYDILADQAYDHIDGDIALAALSQAEPALLYHGTLIAREARSLQILNNLLSATACSAFVDVNLRSPWWRREQVQETLNTAKWAKLNEDELATVMGRHMLSDTEQQPTAQQLFTIYGLELLVITLGDKGAFFVTPDGVIQGTPASVNKVVDTVGAGDSFSAVMIMGILKQWPVSITLHRALDFAAAVCEFQGATTTNRQLYESFLDAWR